MFHVSTKSRYGLRTLVELAIRGKNGPVSLRDLSIGQNISKKYLENIFRMLQRNGIIRSIRGARGGYLLARKPDELTVLDILNAIDGPVELLECIGNTDCCDKVKDCPTRNLWKDLEFQIIDFLKDKTLKGLMEEYLKGKSSYQGMYI